MSTVELKDVLIQKINDINDISLLNALNRILDRGVEEVITLPLDVQEDIKVSRTEIKQGIYLKQDTLDKEIEQWFNSK